MKVYLTLFFWIVFVFTALSQQKQAEYKVFYYLNGQVSSEGSLIDGKPDGYWKTYYENGLIKSEGNRLNFLLDSLWKFYNEEGLLSLEINYKEGKKNGLRKTHLPSETIHELFENDIKNGFTKHFDIQGRLTRKVPFVNGLEEGISMSYDSLGTIIELAVYKRGYLTEREKINRRDSENRQHGPWKWFDDEGYLKAEGNYKNGLRNGIFRTYDKGGNLLTIEKYIDDVLQEEAEEVARLEVKRDYYPTGKVKTEATFRKGVPEGVRREFDEQGNVIQSFIYKNGIIIGQGIMDTDGFKEGFWEERYPDGSLKSKGHYKKGKRTGNWEFFYPDGKLEQKGNYNEYGQTVDQWVWYYNSGELLREENYRNGLRDGLMTEFDQSGKLIVQGDFIDDKEEGFWRITNGDFIEEGDFIEGKRQGLWKHYYGDGTLAFEGHFIEDQPNDTHIMYHPNGKKAEEGNYLMGRKNGDWKKWDEDGTLLLIINFVNGIERSYDGINLPDEEIIMDVD